MWFWFTARSELCWRFLAVWIAEGFLLNHVASELALAFRNERDGPVSGREQRAKPERNGVAEV